MSQIPASLQFFTSSLSGLSRNNVKLQSQSATSMATNGSTMIRFALPSASICDMASFVIGGDTVTTGVASNGGAGNNRVVGLTPSGGLKSMIARTAFSCGGVSLSNDVNYADVISRVKDNLECSISNAYSDKRVMEAYEIQPINARYPPTTGGVGQDRKCMASNLLGFAQCQPRYLDASLIPQLFVSVTLAGRQNIPVQFENGTLDAYHALGTGTTDNASFSNGSAQCEFAVNNVYASIDVISIGSGLYANMLQSLMAERGSVTCCFPSYNSYSNEFGGAAGEVRGALSVSNLHKVYAVHRLTATATAGQFKGQYFEGQQTWTTQQPPVRMQDNFGILAVQAAHSFTAIGQQYWRWRINNAPFPLWDADPMDAYVAAANGEDRLRKSQPGSLVTSLAGWQGSQYCVSNRFSLDNDPRKLSGLNLAALSAAITYNSQGDASTEAGYSRQCIMICESTSRLQIAPGRAISLTH